MSSSISSLVSEIENLGRSAAPGGGPLRCRSVPIGTLAALRLVLRFQGRAAGAFDELASESMLTSDAGAAAGSASPPLPLLLPDLLDPGVAAAVTLLGAGPRLRRLRSRFGAGDDLPLAVHAHAADRPLAAPCLQDREGKLVKEAILRLPSSGRSFRCGRCRRTRYGIRRPGWRLRRDDHEPVTPYDPAGGGHEDKQSAAEARAGG
ncbi:hypothetical protein GW17_00028742 [Ensete ventricosum]|nr:hypothetical protein GW17_00028742 [Ensete ventricosum]